ncbi:MAG: BrnT family toxin [Acidobacteria bacterium]|nr:BrnT family toxin [Acidobacteriota bacterium]
MVFEWDVAKAETNLARHGVSFEEAATVFVDPDALNGADQRHSGREERFLRLGRSVTRRMIVVAHTLRKSDDGEAIRIISARRANRREAAAYPTPERN